MLNYQRVFPCNFCFKSKEPPFRSVSIACFHLRLGERVDYLEKLLVESAEKHTQATPVFEGRRGTLNHISIHFVEYIKTSSCIINCIISGINSCFNSSLGFVVTWGLFRVLFGLRPLQEIEKFKVLLTESVAQIWRFFDQDSSVIFAEN